jgi:DNA-binding NarL/FixJ family response regulator
MKRATVVLADDHEVVLQGLRRVLEPEFDVAGVAADGLALIKLAARVMPDAIVVDVSMPLLNGIQAAREIRMSNARSRIIFLSMHPDMVYVSEALQAGGSAYVLKSSAGTEIVTAIQHALNGGTFVSPAIDKDTLEAQIRRDQRSRDVLNVVYPRQLSPRQHTVLQMVAEGRSTKEIAELLHISPRTVEFHRYRAMEALGVHTIAELVQYAIKHRMVSF